ncbi:MAG: type II toxin-antitoxin system RelE/ParE family toxin [Patescibacteria group bacterium]
MNWSRNWVLEVDPAVHKKLSRMPRDYAERITAVIGLLPVNPYFGDIEKLKGEDNAWRRRVGSYRIFYRVLVLSRKILVFKVERRTSGTYR